ncbi:uncharacterized protein LOC116263865 [Nymphaea colorata]|nr:uncharacterized protein LOC116263865 [Nymphaea colorata]
MKGQKAEGKNTERRQRRFLLCFRPSAIATDSPKGLAGRPASSDPAPKAFDYFSNEETSPKRKKKQPSASEDLNERRRRKFRPLSGIKAAIFGSSKGAARSGRVQQDPSRSSDTSENVSNEPVPAEIHQEQSPKSTVSITHKTESNSVTSSSSSSCSVFGVSKTSSCSSRRKLDSPASSAESEESVHSPSPRPSVRKSPSPTRISAPTGPRGLDPVIGLCYLLAISLLTTLIWGQIPAVICTSIWLYFFGRTRGRLWPGSRRRGECLLDPSVIGSRDYHKRVIMEGILDRRHHRHHHHRASSPADQ